MPTNLNPPTENSAPRWAAHQTPYPHITGPGTRMALPNHLSDPELMAWIKIMSYINQLEDENAEMQAQIEHEWGL